MTSTHYYARLYEHTHRFSTTPNCLISLISFFNCLLFINSYHCKMDLNINGTLNFNTIKLLGSFITLRHALHRKLHRKRRLLNLSSWENIDCLQILVPSQISLFLFWVPGYFLCNLVDKNWRTTLISNFNIQLIIFKFHLKAINTRSIAILFLPIIQLLSIIYTFLL